MWRLVLVDSKSFLPKYLKPVHAQLQYTQLHFSHTERDIILPRQFPPEMRSRIPSGNALDCLLPGLNVPSDGVDRRPHGGLDGKTNVGVKEFGAMEEPGVLRRRRRDDAAATVVEITGVALERIEWLWRRRREQVAPVMAVDVVVSLIELQDPLRKLVLAVEGLDLDCSTHLGIYDRRRWRWRCFR